MPIAWGCTDTSVPHRPIWINSPRSLSCTNERTAKRRGRRPRLGPSSLVDFHHNWVFTKTARHYQKKERLLSELLGNQGYATGAAISHSYCGSAWQFDQGFDTFDESNVLGHSAVTSRGVTDRALDFVTSLDGSQPYFLFAHYFDPHFAYVEHEDYPFGGGDAYQGPIKSDMRVQALRKQSRGLNDADVHELFRLYDSEIAFTDAEIGRLLQRIEHSVGLDNTMIIFTADHGEEFLDHGRWGHTTRLYDEVVRVPLLIHYPDGHVGRVATPVGLTDVAPTVLAALNLKPSKHHVGVDLRSPHAPDRTIFSETSKGAQAVAAIQGRHKLILDKNRGSSELFDLVSDPKEQTDKAVMLPDVVKTLQAAIGAWEDTNRSGKKRGAAVELTQDEVEQLEALGYVDP